MKKPEPVRRGNLRLGMSNDRGLLKLEVTAGGKPFTIQMTSADADDFIHNLAEVRGGLLDEVPVELDPGAIVERVKDPAWRLPKADEDRVAVDLRHPGFGWIRFEFPRAEGAEIGRHLTGQGR